jgi:hypothetical protein
MVVDGQVVIGREAADLTISDPEVSRRHTVVRATDTGIEVEDLGSMNGTFVDGVKITGRTRLDQNGTIKIGPAEIAVEIKPAPASTPVTGGVHATRVSGGVAPEGLAATRVSGAPVAEGLEGTRVSGAPVAEGLEGTRVSGGQLPPTPAAAGPPPSEPDEPRGDSGGNGGGPPKALLGALAAVVVGVAVALPLVLSGGGHTRKNHAFQATVISALYSPPAQVIQIMAVVQGDPLGNASSLIERTTPSLPTPGGPPVPLTLHIVISDPAGSFTSDMTGTTRLTKTGVEITSGTAHVTSGTGTYKGITGRFTVTGGGQFAFPRPGLTNTSTFKINGHLKY